MFQIILEHETDCRRFGVDFKNQSKSNRSSKLIFKMLEYLGMCLSLIFDIFIWFCFVSCRFNHKFQRIKKDKEHIPTHNALSN